MQRLEKVWLPGLKIAFVVCLILVGVLGFRASGPMTTVQAQANVPIAMGTTVDLTGNGAAQQVAGSGTVRWIQVIADSANAASVRVGDSNVTATRGAKLSPGTGFMTPPPTNANFVYSLSTIYVFAASGDKVSILYGN